MIWESFSLDKLYRTKDFKLTLPKYSSTVNKQPLIDRIEPYIDYYALSLIDNDNDNNKLESFDLDIHLNKTTCSIYHRYKTNSTYYFHYYANGFFYLYTQIYLNAQKHFNNQSDDSIDESVIYQWERYLLQLNFINEVNKELFEKEMANKINYHFKYNNFIFNKLSYFDIILLSIISRNNLLSLLLSNVNNNDISGFNRLPLQYSSIKRWFEYIKSYLELDFETIQKMYIQKEKENLFETYKMTSNQILVQAVREQNYNLLQVMLENNENVNSRNLKEFKTLCHWACAKSDRKALDILLKYNCDLEALDFENMTPIFDGIYSGNIDFCEYLIEEKKVKVNHKEIQDRTPFYWAACTGRIEMIKYLLTKPNIDINAVSKMGRTSLSKSCWNGQVDVTELLCKQKGILINTPDNNGRYPIHNAVWGEYGGRQGKKMSGLTTTDSPEAALCLINHGADIEIIDNEGDSPFMIAASTNGIESMKILIKHRANPNRVNNKGRTGLIQATQYGNWESVQSLLSLSKEGYFIDLNLRDKYSYRAIDYAVLYQRIICFTILFEFDKSYQSIDEMIYLTRLSIQSNSCLCFEYVFNHLIKVNIDDTIYEEFIIRTLAMKNISCFNLIYKVIPDITKAILLKKNNKDAQMIELIYACHLRNIDIDVMNKEQNAITILPEHPFNYAEIKKKKMTEVDNMYFFQEKDEALSVAMTWTPQISKEFENIINNLLNEYLNANDIKGEISDSMMKILIQNNLYFLISNKDIDTMKIYHTTNSIANIAKDYHSQLFVMKQGITPSNNYDSIWKEIINYYNSNSILSMAIITNNSNTNDTEDNAFFNFLIKHKEIKSTIFDITPLNNQNIFHILFSNVNYKTKFDTIIKIIETEYPLKIRLIPSMLNECNSFSSTPLDILMKSENYSMLETYTSIIHNLLSKHSINNNTIQGIDLYSIKSFTITPTEMNSSIEYKNFIYDRLNQLKPKKTIDNQSDIYFISNYPIDNDIKEKVDYCLNKINTATIEPDFFISNKDNKHKFIQTEKELIEVSKELSQEKVIGIDAEFNGYNCDIDGIVCLLQISSFNISYAIDTLSLRHEIGKWLKPIFDNDNIVKVFHGCDNDICWLLGNFDLYFRNVFDTGRAFLVYQNIILNKLFKLDNLPSLYYLVKFFIGVKLDKSYQTSDWRIRPLTNNMVQYGLNDSKSVLYLYYIFQGLYLWLIKDAFIMDNITHLDYYKTLKPKFAKDREALAKIPNDLSIEETRPLLIKIAYKCYELVKMKLRDCYIHLDITLTK